MSKKNKEYKVYIYSDKQNSSFFIIDKQAFLDDWINRKTTVYEGESGEIFGHDLSQFKSMSMEEVKDD